MSSEINGVQLRMPTAGDGYAIYNLITNNPPLDPNSVYSYHLLSDHFRETCVVAEYQQEIAGFLSAYLIPNRPDTLFVWQVVVSPVLRGKHIATHMLEEVLSRDRAGSVKYVEATVNPDNVASRTLFTRLAERNGSRPKEHTYLDESAFGSAGGHDIETLLRISLRTEH